MFKNISRVFEESFGGVSRKEVFNRFQVYLKEVQKEVLGSFKDVSMVVQESFLCVSRKFQECFKEN